MNFLNFTEKHFKLFTEISSRCYPGMKLTTEQAKQRFEEGLKSKQNWENINYIGLVEDHILKAGYASYDFSMNIYQNWLPAKGIGLVAVDLPYKKQGLAKKLINNFIQSAVKDKQPLVFLYPFRPDFYKKMGFGYGTKMNTYKFRPDQLPNFQITKGFLFPTMDQIRDCYHYWADKTHGACMKRDYEWEGYFDRQDVHCIGFEESGQLTGYIFYTFKNKEGDNFLQNDLHIIEYVFTNENSLRALLSFLHNQKDQIRHIYFPTQEESMEYLFDDPRSVNETLIYSIYHETNQQGVGVMYRIVDIPLFFSLLEDYSFGEHDITIRWQITDTLLYDGATSVTVQFKDGHPNVNSPSDPDVTIYIDISDFSSLMMGVVSLERLVWLQRVELSDRKKLTICNDMFSGSDETYL